MEGVLVENVIAEPGGLHMELMDATTREVWQSRLSVRREDYGAMVPAVPFVKIGIGRIAADAHGFRRSPGAGEDGPMERRVLGGREFLYCAKPVEDLGQTGPDGPRQLRVEKHHSLLFRAGRSVEYLRLPDGTRLVHVIAAEAGAAPAKLPDGWKRETVELQSDLTVHLPCPATVFFFANGDSFQGPV